MTQKQIIIAIVVILAIGLGISVVNKISEGNQGMSKKSAETPKQDLTQQVAGSSALPSSSQQPTVSGKPKHYNQFPGVYSKAELQNQKAVIETSKGTIEFEIYPEASMAASNFIHLANDGFYDSLTFHRVVPGFVIQGGDPEGNGTGGPGYKFADEPVKRKYDKGIVAMANSGPNTNGSQFFIMLEDNPLPPLYTIFGKVISGIDVVGKISVGDVMNKVSIKSL